MKSNKKRLDEGFRIAGLSEQTDCDPMPQTAVLGGLWQQFNIQNVVGQLSDRLGNQIYCVYTDYCEDPVVPGMIVLGARVKSEAEVPDHLTSVHIPAGLYRIVQVEGHLPFATSDAWEHIDETLSHRRYKTDFEIYDARSLQAGKAEVEIFIGMGDEEE